MKLVRTVRQQYLEDVGVTVDNVKMQHFALVQKMTLIQL